MAEAPDWLLPKALQLPLVQKVFGIVLDENDNPVKPVIILAIRGSRIVFDSLVDPIEVNCATRKLVHSVEFCDASTR